MLARHGESSSGAAGWLAGAVADVAALLDKLGLTDRTLVLYLSDNGLHLGEHWLGDKIRQLRSGQ